jgi:hypothetical protein
MEGNPNPAPGQLQHISVQAFAAKFKTKREVFNFLTIDCHAYEPAIQCVTVWHMRD